MKSVHCAILALCAGLPLAGCTFDAGGIAPAGPTAAPVTLSVLPGSHLDFTLTFADAARPPSPVDLAVTGGSFTIADSPDGPVLEALDADLADVNVSADSLPPAGLQLRDLHLSLPKAAPVPLVPDETADAGGAGDIVYALTTPLDLSWSLVGSDGKSYPLRPVKTAPVSGTLRISLSAAGPPYAAVLDVAAHGHAWTYADLVYADDAEMILDAVSAPR